MPVGHIVEALKYTKGFADSNKSLDIYLALNSSTTTELAKSCSWIKKVYSVDVEDIWKKGKKANSFKKIPKKWDYIVSDKRSKNLSNSGYERKMRKYYGLTNQYLSASWIDHTKSWFNKDLPRELNYKPNSKIELKVPKKAENYIKKLLRKDKFRIAVLLAGSANAGEYPSIESWIYILKEIKKKYPEVSFYITGYNKPQNGRTSTNAYSKEDIDKLFREVEAINCYNIGLWNQIVLIKESDIFLSPHTGFAFLAMCVGTPWLTLSGGNWPEYIFNDVAFYSVLPKTKEYPFYASKIKFNELSIDEKRRVSKMDSNGIKERMKDIINGIKLLTDKSFTYKKSIKQHLHNINKSGINKKALFVFDSQNSF